MADGSAIDGIAGGMLNTLIITSGRGQWKEGYG